ncbi:MAG: arsenate reductase [Burkholderiales bacterium]|nr:arsenate reductase [Burkholderiales bacterium]
MIKVYGIPNCDTVKKARAWLTEQGVAHEFHDFKKAGVPEDRLDAWIGAVGWDKLLNRRGPTWRKLDPELQASVVDGASAKPVMIAHSSVIKRPVVEWDNAITVGFDASDWASRA